MVRIEIKKVAEGQVALGMEAKEETPDEVLMCAARGFVGVARNLLGADGDQPTVCRGDFEGHQGDAAGYGRPQGNAGRRGQRSKVYGSTVRDECGGEK